MAKFHKSFLSIFILSLLILPLLASPVLASPAPEAAADEEDECAFNGGGTAEERAMALKYKIGALFAILIAGIIGVCLPIYGLDPDKNFFFFMRAFAAGVILATGFVHILPDATESLTSPCIGKELPWGDFPMTGLIAMAAAILTMMIESFASGYFKRSAPEEILPVSDVNRDEKEENGEVGECVVDVHTHASHGHSHGSVLAHQIKHLNFREKIVTQALEIGIVVHSVIIGVSLGASPDISAIKPLLAAITFHQLFEGFGLGGCISKAKFKLKTIAVMITFFALTAPAGIAIGIGVSQTYNENSPTALIVSGVLNAAAAGILIYMALVDLVAPQFMNEKVESSLKIQIACSFSLVLGAGLMSLLAIWA